MTRRLSLLPRRSGSVLGAVAVIGVGVGLAAMVFALADAYVWKPLPYASADRLVAISFDSLPSRPDLWATVPQADIPTLASWRARTELVEDVAAFEDRGWLRVQVPGRIVPLRAVAVTENLLDVLGLEPRMAEADEAVAWVSHRAAATLSGGELQPGRSASVSPSGTLRIRSVLPRSFLLPQANRTLPVDVLVVRSDGHVMSKEDTSAATATPYLIARTRVGVTPQVLEAALAATMPGGRQVFVVPLSIAMTARLHGLATGALLATGLLVLVCWINVFTIALTRGFHRESELATRTALGATPGGIVRLLMGEGGRVATLGGVAALGAAWVALSAAMPILPAQFATIGVPSMTPRVVAAVLLVSAVAGLFWSGASILAWWFGTAGRPRRLAARGDGRTIRVVRFAVVAGQLAAASVLLAGAALLGRSYLNLLGTEAGMDGGAQTVTVAHDPALPEALRYDLIQRTLSALQRAPGVHAVGASSGSLLDGRSSSGVLWEAPVHDSGRPPIVDWILTTGDYADALGLRVVAGRPPPSGEPGVVMTESAVQRYYDGRPPIGDLLSNHERTSVPIVGVIRDVRHRALGPAPRPAVYELGSRLVAALPTTTYVVNAVDSVGVAEWERIVQRLDPMAIVLDAGTVQQRLGRSILDRTFAALVVGLFAMASVAVTALGLAGVVAYTVVKRTKEIAVRRALGATGSTVTRLVVRDALVAATCGIVGGAIAAAWLSRMLESLLYEVRPADPATLVLSATGLLVIVIGAAVVPAVRAARIEPAAALRSE